MPRIWLLRHAKSDWPHDVPDEDRPLAPRGHDDAPRMGQWIAAQGAPTTVISSPAVRARQTILEAGAAWGLGEGGVVWDLHVYGAGVADLVRVLDAHGGDRLVCGHNPGLDGLLQWLLAEPAQRTPSGKLMTTCTAACIDVPEGPLARGTGRLVAMKRPGDLRT